MNDTTKVLWLAKGLGRGGAEMLLVELAWALRDAPIRLDVGYVLPHKDALVQPLLDAGVGVHCLTTGGRASWVGALRTLLHDGSYDVVHTHAPVIASAARVLAPRESVLVHTEHNTWDRYRLPTRWANAATLRRNTVVWPVSQGVASSIRHWPLPGSRPSVEVMLHGIAPGRIARGPAARLAARRLLGIPDDAPAVVAVGNLTPKKDHETLLRSFALLSAALPQARLVVMGDGPRRPHLVDLIGTLGLRERVQLLGVRDDVPELLAGFDAFAMSSLHEGLSIALVEAMAAGVVPVATRVGGIPELVTDNEHGLLVPARSPAAFASALERVLGDQRLRERMSRAGRARAGEFGIDRAATRLEVAYAELARTRALTEVAA